MKRPSKRIEFIGGPADGDVRTFGDDPPITYRIPIMIQHQIRPGSDRPEEDDGSGVATYLFDPHTGRYYWDRMKR